MRLPSNYEFPETNPETHIQQTQIQTHTIKNRRHNEQLNI